MRTVEVHIPDRPFAAEVLEDASQVHENSGGIFETRFERQEVAQARLHVWSAHVEGSYATTLRNTGRLPILRTRVNDLRSQLQEAPARLADTDKSIGFFRRGNTVKFTNQFHVRGVRDSAWALINIFFTGSCTVVETANVTGLGYNKSHNVRVRIPVRSVSVHWDAD